jgi:hypothetical protein
LDLLSRLRRAVEQIEHQQCPRRAEDVKALVGEICTAPWRTAEEREKAQGLVARLERLVWYGEESGPGDET